MISGRPISSIPIATRLAEISGSFAPALPILSMSAAGVHSRIATFDASLPALQVDADATVSVLTPAGMNFAMFISAALPAYESMHGLVDATYTPRNGSPSAVKVTWQSRLRSNGRYPEGHFIKYTGRLIVKAAYVPDPQPGDTFLIGSTTYVIDDHYIISDVDDTFIISVVSLSQSKATARVRGITR